MPSIFPAFQRQTSNTSYTTKIYDEGNYVEIDSVNNAGNGGGNGGGGNSFDHGYASNSSSSAAASPAEAAAARRAFRANREDPLSQSLQTWGNLRPEDTTGGIGRYSGTSICSQHR